MAIRGCGKLETIAQLYEGLDEDFKAELEASSDASCLFRLLKVPKSNILKPLVETLLRKYDCKKCVFAFGLYNLNVTLEDVLFLTGLPIWGEPVISSNSRDEQAFTRVFGEQMKRTLSMEQLRAIAIDVTKEHRKRKIAVLLIIISCFIVPSSDGQRVDTTYVQFVERLEEVDSYAWGAALLAFLYSGINKCKGVNPPKGAVDGNLWVLMEVLWSPYSSSLLPRSLQDQVQFGTLLAPLFCNNYVVHHRPHLVARQFNVFKERILSTLRWDEHEIQVKQNRGPRRQNFRKNYEKELQIWGEKQLAQDLMCRVPQVCVRRNARESIPYNDQHMRSSPDNHCSDHSTHANASLTEPHPHDSRPKRITKARDHLKKQKVNNDESEFRNWRRQIVSEIASSTCQEQDEEHIAATSAQNVRRESKEISSSEKNDRNIKKRKASDSNEFLCSSSSTESNSNHVSASLQDFEASSYGAKQDMDVCIAKRTRSKMGSIKKTSEVANVSLGSSVDSDSSPNDSGNDTSLDEDFEVEISNNDVELLSSHVEACEVRVENEEMDTTFHHETDAEEGLKEKINLKESSCSNQSNTKKGYDHSGDGTKERTEVTSLNSNLCAKTAFMPNEKKVPTGAKEATTVSHSKDGYDHSDDGTKERTEVISSDSHLCAKTAYMANEKKVPTGAKEATTVSHSKDGYDHSDDGAKEITELTNSDSHLCAKTAFMANEKKVPPGAMEAAPLSHSKDRYDHSDDGPNERTEETSSDSRGAKVAARLSHSDDGTKEITEAATTSDSHLSAKNKPVVLASEKKVPTGPKEAAPSSYSKDVYDHSDEGNKERTEAASSDSHDPAVTEAADMANVMEVPMKRKQVSSNQVKDLCIMLADAVLGGGLILASQTQTTLPWKFRFEDEVPEQVEKTEYEKEIDSLFCKLDSEWALEELQSFDYPKDILEKESSPPEETQHARCSRGKHELVLEDEEGLICIFCRHVELGPKDVMPEWAERTYRESERKRCSEPEQLLEYDELHIHPSTIDDADSRKSSTATGTVWSIKPGVLESMYEHQREGFEFLWKNLAGSINLDELKSTDPVGVGGCIISHAPGTGKTRLTIVFVETYFKMFPNCMPVIISPASTLLTWEEEFKKWNVEFPFHNLSNFELSGKENKAALELIPQTKIKEKEAIRMIKICSWSMGGSFLGISYNLFEKLTGERNTKEKRNKKRKYLDSYKEKMRKILLEKPGLVVLDEGHTPRNHRSSIWNVLLKLKTEKRVILSGTPFQNNFGELFNTLRIVRPAIADVLARKKLFGKTVVAKNMSSSRKHKGEHWQSSMISEDVDRAVEYLKTCMSPFVHLHKGDILQQSLPGLRDCIVLLKPPTLQNSLIERLQSSNNFIFQHKVSLISVHPYLFLHCETTEDAKIGIDMAAVEASKLNPHEGVKTRFLLELVRLSMAVKERVLVFSQYIQPLELIKEQLKEVFKWVEGKEILHIHGKQYQKQRQISINLFNDPQSASKIMLASTKCCSEGISLVGASRVVLLDVVWNPSVERQAICRAYRIGQKKFVHTYHLMTSGTTEADKYCRQAEKERLSELVFSSSNESNRQKHPSSGIEDRILEVMISHDGLKGMFEKIINQPKETDLIQTFGLTS
ncbi:SNF2 domain-containing protein CLASSY 4-like isoform X2 [Salvia miltiorrhiza]|uniref:SNF2 domain-containing protein CLASSY 4-like isoform X2 n=1 Tax=Salvia miltiorrhiza TaxID=226208 RepID=UPI0025AC5300|nr:SNF2 domain-containing protein CLASSY 4-like isoform X2 [Salvia miltiorrhiza]XP_057807502.1 SNF2 domain-containing protein CLASSY 4-like isoform X2 [Salvia miltiorrhiza]